MNSLNNKEKIQMILLDSFDYVYCPKCAFEQTGEDERCMDCHRKSMLWSISTKYAEELAEKILNELEVK